MNTFYILQSLHYSEVIANKIQENPVLYQAQFVRQVYELGNRLKSYDPQRLQTGEDMEDPYWLQNLARVVQAFEVRGN